MARGSMMGVELWRHKRVGSDLVKLLIPFVVLTLPWFCYLYWREGLLLPGSFQGKQVSYVQTLRMMDARNPALARLTLRSQVGTDIWGDDRRLVGGILPG